MALLSDGGSLKGEREPEESKGKRPEDFCQITEYIQRGKQVEGEEKKGEKEKRESQGRTGKTEFWPIKRPHSLPTIIQPMRRRAWNTRML